MSERPASDTSEYWLQMTSKQIMIRIHGRQTIPALNALSAVYTFDDEGMAYFFRSTREEGSLVRRASAVM